MRKLFIFIFVSLNMLIASDSLNKEFLDKTCLNNVFLSKDSSKEDDKQKLDLELVKLLLERQDKNSELERQNLKTYYDFVNTGFVYNERFIYIVGSILTFVAVLVLIIASVLGIWNGKRFNNAEKDFKQYKKELDLEKEKLQAIKESLIAERKKSEEINSRLQKDDKNNSSENIIVEEDPFE